MAQPALGRVHVFVDCSCKCEVEFDDADLSGGYESQECDNCGKKVEIHLEIEVSHPRG